MASGGGGALQVENIFHLLESSDTVNDIRKIILENLLTTKDSTWLIHLLVDYYFRTQSTSVQEILAELKESQVKALMDKLLDGIKSPTTRLPALQLVLYLVYRELPWCHQFVEMPLFTSVIKCMKTEIDVPILMTSLMIIVILLPTVPVSMGRHLPHIFENFGRLSTLCIRRPANTPEVYLLHLQVALYSLFNRLYGMYPCSFTTFITKFYTQKENIHVYEEVIMPMLERVRLHPKLLMGQKETETETSRWKNQETQDIVVNCSKLSLDLIEGSWEDSHCPVLQTIQSVGRYRLLNQSSLHGDKTRGRFEASPTNSVKTKTEDQVSINSLYVPNLDVSNLGESPSVLIGLSTPPQSQRTTPATSLLDSGSVAGHPFDTPELTPRLHTPSVSEEGEKTPLSRSSSKSSFHQAKPISTPDSKKPSVVIPKATPGVPHTTPVTPCSYSLASPSPTTPGSRAEETAFRSSTSAFGAPFQSRSPAMRNLQFIPAVEEKEEGELKSRAGSQSNSDSRGPSKSPHTPNQPTDNKAAESQEEKRQKSVPIKSLHHVIGSLNTSDVDTLDLEVEEINEREDQFDEGSSPSSSVTTLASQTDVTAESVRQFMKKVNRIRFNSLTSNSSSDFDAVSVASGVPIQRTRRPRSCPPLKRQSLQSQHTFDSSSIAKARSKKQPSAGDSFVSGPGFSRQRSMIENREMSDLGQSEDSLEERISLSTGSSKESPPKSKDFTKGQPTPNTVVKLTPPLPASVNPVFQYILAPSKLAVCNSCHQQIVVTSNQPETMTTTVTTFKDNEVSLFSRMSPPELLDRHLRLGSDIHAKELTKIPLTSKESTNWTHFGGVPPADEVNILRGQILLMQNQLMYERHKRSNHAKRNRRLLSRIAHITKLEEQEKTLFARVSLHEEEIQQLNVSLKLLQEENTKLKDSQESDEYEKLVHFRTSLKENKDLKAASRELKNLLLSQREDYDKQQKKLEGVQHQNLELQKELDMCKGQLANTEKLKQKVFQLQKEVLLNQEFHQKCQEKLHQSSVSTQRKIEESYLTNSLKAEISELKKDNKKKTVLLDAYQTRVSEMEQLLKTKETAMTKIKRNFEEAKSCHDEQLQTVEERCKSMVHINQQLEAKLMELTCQLDQTTHKKMLEATKTASRDAISSTSPSSLTKYPDGNKVATGMPATKLDSVPKTEPSKDSAGQGQSDIPLPSESLPKFSKSDVMKDWEIKGEASVPKATSLVMAKEEVSLAGSTFVDNPTKTVATSPVPNIPTHRLDTDILSDSGAASRSSFRLGSDASVKSQHSVITKDSGCWPKD